MAHSIFTHGEENLVSMSATRSVVAKMQTPTALEKLARGEDVLAWLKQTTPSISAVKSALSRIKAAALAQLDVPDSVYDALAPYAATAPCLTRA